MEIVKRFSTFGLIVGTRGFFNPQLAATAREKLIKKLDAMGHQYIIPTEKETPNGAIETRADARICAELFSRNREIIDGIIVVLPNFGDEIGIVQTIQLSDLDVPVLVHACSDDLDKLDLKHRRDAFCGKISVCNNFYQYGIPFTDTTGHTDRIESKTFERDIDFFSRVCRVVRGLKRARIGAIGARPAPFQTVRYSEKLLQACGITVVPEDLSTIIYSAESIQKQDSRIEKTVERISAYGFIPEDVSTESIKKQARLTIALEQWMEENECDASAVQCWTSIEENYGCAACLSMSLMGESGFPSACEVDVTGAVSMYALLLASGNPPALQDWNNNYEYDKDKCINVHCSNYPKTFMGSEIEISSLDVLGASLGPENCFGAVKGKVASGPMTFFRVSTDDRRAAIHCYLGEGDFTDDPCAIAGGGAVCRVPGLRQLMRWICKNGFEHHIAVTRGHCADVIYEAVSTYLKWDIHYHGHGDD